MSSLLIGVTITLIVILLTNLYNVIRMVGSLVTWCRSIKRLRSLPSPPGHWFWKHALKVGPTQESLMYMQENHKRYPNLCVYWIGPFMPCVFSGNIETMKIFLYQPGESPKPPIYGYLDKWVGEGLSTSSGALWRKHREMLTAAFHLDILKDYVPVYNEISHRFLDIWRPFVGTGESIDVTEYTSLYTMDVLLKCIFSSDSNCLENKGGLHVEAYNKLAFLFIERVFTPYYIFDWIYFSTPAGRKFLHYCDVVHKFSDDVIKQRREELLKKVQRSQQARKYKDFLDILLSVKDENDEGLTDAEIRQEVDTFMFAGHDNTAAALGWCLYCLAMNKEHQELCRKEIRGILIDRDSDDILWDDLSKLAYTTMCIQETLRLYPTTPFISKLSSENVVVNGHKIPKGTWVSIGIYTMQHDPLIWEDPEKFNPMRFSVEKCKDMDSFTFLTFSAGPRNCIAQRFALHQLKVTLALILNRLELDVDETHAVQPYWGGIYKSKTGIKLKLSFAS